MKFLLHYIPYGLITKISLCCLLLSGLTACGNTQIPDLLKSSEGQATQSSTKSTFNPFGTNEEKPSLAMRRKNAPPPTIAELMKAGPLEERFLGRKNAPVTVIEYASMTCPVCRKFHTQTFPAFKKKYIDSGKVRYIIREFPIGHASGVATLALRCAKNNKDYFKLYDAYLSNQRLWVSLKIRHDEIYKVAKKATGMTRARFNHCISDKKLAANLQAIKQAGRELGVIGTPSFFINGHAMRGAKTLSEMDAVIQPMLQGKVATVKAK